ncbi:hypothetical protein BJV77DRAFT_620870 [Russula vinacea]|nr:hypothetical protein BJV77DRAFT_620870 [Russula vinacea]
MSPIYFDTYLVTRHAETCTATRVQHSSHSSSNLEQLVPTFLQSAALFGTLSNSIPTEHKPQQPILLSYKARRNVLDSSRSQSALYSFRTKDSSPLAFPITPHASAALEIRSQRISCPNRQPYQLTQRAETCTAARAQDSHLTPQSEEQVTTTFLKVAAPASGFSDLVPTYPRFGLVVPSNFAACRSVHDHSRAWIALYPLGARINIVQAPLRVQHSRAVFVIRSQHTPDPDNDPYEVLQRAEACTTARAHNNAALVRGLSDLTPTYPTLGLLVQSSFAACGSVHDHSRAWIALHPLIARINLVQVSPKQQHKSACLETQLRRLPYPDRPLYQVTSCAESCATARAQDFYFSPQSEEPSILTLLQNAAPVRVLSDLAATLLIPRLPRKLSLTACKDVHDCSRPQSVPQRFKKNSRSGRDDEGEHDALSWEEIPSPACIPPILPCLSSPRPSQYINQTIHSSFRDTLSSYPPGHSFSLASDDFSVFIPFCSPHTHAITDSMLGTAFFFSWEENWGSQRPFLTSLKPLHALAALATSHQRALYVDRFLHKVTSRAELCTTSCVQYSPLSPRVQHSSLFPFSRTPRTPAPLATYVRRSRDVDRLSYQGL